MVLGECGAVFDRDLVDKGLCAEAVGINQGVQYTRCVPARIRWRYPLGPSGSGANKTAPRGWRVS